MTKALIIDPQAVQKKDALQINDIPLNQYQPDIEWEREVFGEDGLRRMYFDMLLIREFETMLDDIKKKEVYQGIEYNHRGPAHLAIGQESAAVGQCFHLGCDDFIFGSHRSHGEILAKCFSAIVKQDPDHLLQVMRGWNDGETLSVIEKGHQGDVYDLAFDFAIYATLAEIFARSTGMNKGLGGSMHAFFPPFGSMPNNAIVGGSADICLGAALYKRINRKPGIVIGNIGDASMGCGPVWEAIMLGSMDQYRVLWDPQIGGAPPVIFNFFNNFYGMGGQTTGETMGFKILARVGAGVNPDNMHAERVNGYNPLAVADAIARKRAILEEGRGPVLMDTVTYRLSGHSPSDASSYRSKEELNLWKDADCIESYGRYLDGHGILNVETREAMREKACSKMKRLCELAASTEHSPYLDSEYIEKVMYSFGRAERLDEREPELLIPDADNPRVQSNARKARFGLDEKGRPLPRHKVLAVRDALFEAMLHRFSIDPSMVAYGEENRDWGGAFGVYRGLTESLPYHRLFNASISEGAIVGSGVGYALCGGRAVVELMYCDFMGRAGDEIFNQMAKWQAMSAGALKMPLVLRISVGNKYGAQHSQDWSAMVAHVPGLQVMYPVTPYDAKGMLNLALAGTNPVIFFESQKVYDKGEWFVESGVPEGYYEVPLGQPAVRRSGDDLTLLTLGPTLYAALEAAGILSERHKLEAEVIDLRFANPLDYEIIMESVAKTGRVALVSDACERGSFLHDIASNISQLAFDDLDAPPAVIGSRNWITPAAEMEQVFFPQKEWIIDTIHERILPLPSHKPTTKRDLSEMLRRSRLGV